MTTSDVHKPRPRSGPIVWGALILAFSAWILQRVFAPGLIDPQLWLIGIAVGLGVLLLGVGVFIALRQRQTPTNDSVT